QRTKQSVADGRRWKESARGVYGQRQAGARAGLDTRRKLYRRAAADAETGGDRLQLGAGDVSPRRRERDRVGEQRQGRWLALHFARWKISLLRRFALFAAALWPHRSDDRLLPDSAPESANPRRGKNYQRHGRATGSLDKRRRCRSGSLPR